MFQYRDKINSMMRKLKVVPFFTKKEVFLCTFCAFSFGFNASAMEDGIALKNDIEFEDLGGREEKYQQTVTGVVTDTQGVPIPGVSVTLKENKNNGAVTDFDGNYSIEIPADTATLVFSYLGFNPQEIAVNGQTEINVELEKKEENLEEVVVVGYGTQAKRDITGSISVVSEDEIASRNVTNVSNALQGAAAGVSVTRNSSAPGAGNTIRIRGITTLQGNSSPLILVDDVPVDDINDVNPAEVASISVLKDAASSAIYGSRAAAGVIIITTKKAKDGVFRVSYTNEYLINTPTQIRQNVGSVRYMQMFNEAIWNDNNNTENQYSTYDPEVIANYGSLSAQNPNNYPDTDWRELLLKDQSETRRHNLVLTGGTERLKTNASFGYEHQDALYDKREWKRYTGRINNELQITDKFGAILNMAFRQENEEQPLYDPTEIAVAAGSVYPALWADGRIANGKSGSNPYADLYYGGFNESSKTLVYGKFELYYEPLDGLRFSMNVAPNYEFTKSKRFVNSIPYWGASDPEMLAEPNYLAGHSLTNRSLQETRINNKSLTTQILLDFNRTFGNHHVNSVFGFEEYSNEVEGLLVRGNEFISNEYPFLSQAPVDKVFDNDSNISETAYRSYFGRVAYDYKSKYYVQGTVRRDASSRFASEYRWGTFPSLALGYVLSEENFMKDVKGIDFLKFRGSYGSLGNDRLGNYLYLSTLQFTNTLIANGADVESVRTAAQRYLEVADITWETTSSLNLGFDFASFQNRLSITTEYFDKETSDMLLSLNIPSLSGFDDPIVNVGNMNTKGWEVTVGWKDNIGDFTYSVSGNVYDSKSILGDIGNKRLFSGNTLSEEGIEFQSWYGYQSDGIYQTQEEVNNSAVTSDIVSPGDIKYKDISGADGVPDGEINELDKTVLGGSLPRYQYGGSINLGYKGFDFGVVVQGVAQQTLYLDPNKYATAFDNNWYAPPQLIDGNYWSVYNTAEQNALVEYPRIGNNNRA
ncbi:MAG TPA: TonB-dependent receptor, partial [Leeuwenhoekiella sp.]|nr:TonB-dependent receptor [Leeuwenhoekiella sp.]